MSGPPTARPLPPGAASAARAMPQAAGAGPAPWPALTWPGTQVRRLQSAQGARYQVTVWLPPGDAPPGGFDVLVALDANALFGTFVEAVRRSSRRPDATGIAPAAVIGIAHEGDALFADSLRRRDYTAGPPANEAPPADGSAGGAADFLAFIADALMPQLCRELPLNPARQTLFGHSLAGHFVLQALAARPQAFRTWAAISPSIWWDEAGLRAALQATLAGERGGDLPQRRAAPEPGTVPPEGARRRGSGPGEAGERGGVDPLPRVFLAVGEWEEAVPPWQRQHPGYEQLVARRAQRRMVASARELAADLARWLDASRVAFRLFPEEDHASILMVAVQRTLRFASM